MSNPCNSRSRPCFALADQLAVYGERGRLFGTGHELPKGSSFDERAARLKRASCFVVETGPKGVGISLGVSFGFAEACMCRNITLK